MMLEIILIIVNVVLIFVDFANEEYGLVMINVASATFIIAKILVVLNLVKW